MSKLYKECLVCGKTYEACAFCDSQSVFYAWRSVVCSPEHFAYHVPIIGFIRGQISKEQACSELADAERKYGTLDYADDIKDVVKDIKSVEMMSKPISDNSTEDTVSKDSKSAESKKKVVKRTRKKTDSTK